MSPSHSSTPSLQRIGIAGLGTIGKTLASAIAAGIPGVQLAAVSARNVQAAQDWLAGHLAAPVPVVPLEELAAHCDVVIECAPASVMTPLAEPVLRAGKKLIVLSSGALLERMHLIDLAREHGGQIIVPTGALLGLDAVTAAAEGTIHSVRMVSRKPVNGFRGAPFLAEHHIDIEGITEPLRIFSGKAREAASGFPANLNVAISLSLAGIGPDRTELEIWADPTISRNTHTISVDSDSASFTMTIENIPTENPKTGRITAQSVVALLRKMGAPLRVGT
ncbi:MAG TPA: aspartate dehydrogenase [Burkholderiaceae bacterium]